MVAEDVVRGVTAIYVFATVILPGLLKPFRHEVLDLAASHARRVQDEATEIETRVPRAA